MTPFCQEMIVSKKFLAPSHVVLFLVLIFTRVLVITSSTEYNSVRCLEKERLALLKLKANLVDDYGRLSTWGGEENQRDCCRWKGVRCAVGTDHVVALNLQGPQVDNFFQSTPLRAMAGYYGTTQKCKTCDQTVHFAEMMSADGIPYHKTCFKCSHCSGRLTMSNYSNVDGKLFCKPHFEQLFKETGSFTTKKTPPSGKQGELNRTPSKMSSFFSGTQEKCAVCKKTVYPLEKVTVEGEFYHKSCFKCAHGGCFLTPSSYAALDGILYCKPHFAQLFKEKGSYSHLTKTTSLKKNASLLDSDAAPEQPPPEHQTPPEDAHEEN